MKTFSKPGYSKRPEPRTRATYAVARSAARSFDQTERFQAECASCHARCEVPFRPNGKKPVYCRDCYRANENAASERFAPREDGAADLKKQLGILNVTLDRLAAAIEAQTRALTEGR